MKEDQAVQRAVEEQLRAWEEKSDFLSKRYAKYIDSAAEVYQEVKQRKMSPNMKRNLAVCLENTRELIEKQRFMEQSYSSDVAFANYAFDIVSVILPSLISEEIVSVQAMERRTAEIYYMKTLIDRTKGIFTKDNTLQSPLTGWASNYDATGNAAFAGDWVYLETAYTFPAGTSRVSSGTLAYQFLKAGNLMTFQVYSGAVAKGGSWVAVTVTIGSGGSHIIPQPAYGSGTVNATTGAWKVTWDASGATNNTVRATYRVDLEKEPDAIGKIRLQITATPVTAGTYKLNSEWLMDMAYDLLKAHGRDAEKEILIALTGEVKAEIDATIIRALYDGATGSGVTWNSTVSSGIPWIWHKNQIIDSLISQSSKIFTGTRRAVGNFIVAGVNIGNVIESLDQFQSAVNPSMEFTGAYFAGTLSNRWKVYITPDLPQAKWIQGYVGESYLKSGYVYAPYLPLFTTPTYTTQDFITHKGLGSSFGRLMVNGKMYSIGTMSGTMA